MKEMMTLYEKLSIFVNNYYHTYNLLYITNLIINLTN